MIGHSHKLNQNLNGIFRNLLMKFTDKSAVTF